MKKNILQNITKIICSLFIAATIIIIFFAYKKINNPFASKFGMFYLFLTLFFIVYIILITILNSRKLKWFEIRKRILKFITFFVLIGALNYAGDYIFRPSKIDLLREFSIPLGLSFGICFFDLNFSHMKEKS